MTINKRSLFIAFVLVATALTLSGLIMVVDATSSNGLIMKNKRSTATRVASCGTHIEIEGMDRHTDASGTVYVPEGQQSVDIYYHAHASNSHGDAKVGRSWITDGYETPDGRHMASLGGGTDTVSLSGDTSEFTVRSRAGRDWFFYQDTTVHCESTITVEKVPADITIDNLTGPTEVEWEDEEEYTATISWEGPTEYRMSLYSYFDGIVNSTGWRFINESMSNGGSGTSDIDYDVEFSNIPKRSAYRILAHARPVGASSFVADGLHVDVLEEESDEAIIGVGSANPPSGVSIEVVSGNLRADDTPYEIVGGQGESLSGTLRAPIVASGNDFNYWTGCDDYAGRNCDISVGEGESATVVVYYESEDNGDSNGNGNGNGNGGPPPPQAVLSVSSIGASNVPINHLREDILGPDGITNYTRTYDESISHPDPDGWLWLVAERNHQGMMVSDWNGCDRVGSDNRSCAIDGIDVGETRNLTVIYEEPQPELNSVTITPKNPEIREGESIVFTATVGGDNLSEIHYDFDCGNGQSDIIISNNYQESYECDYGDPGEFTASVEVTSPDVPGTVRRDSTDTKVNIDIFKFIRRFFTES